MSPFQVSHTYTSHIIPPKMVNTTQRKDPALAPEPPLLDQFHNVPRREMLEYMRSISSCCIDGVGIFHLTNCEGGIFCLLLVRSEAETTIFDNETDVVFGGGHEVKRFFPVDSSTLLVQFKGNHDLLVLKSSNGWKSITEKLRKQQSMLNTYLGFNAATQPPNLEALGNADTTIECSDDKKIPVHAWILASRWPFFKAKLAKSSWTAPKSVSRPWCRTFMAAENSWIWKLPSACWGWPSNRRFRDWFPWRHDRFLLPT